MEEGGGSQMIWTPRTLPYPMSYGYRAGYAIYECSMLEGQGFFADD
jgi:hypothetical protein